MKTKETKRTRILEMFYRAGEPISVGELTARCLKENIWSKEDRDRMVLRAAQSEVRGVLNSVDSDDLPIALVRDPDIEEDEDGNVVDVKLYVQREFWTEGDARTWVIGRMKQLREDYEKLSAFINDYCMDRWPETDWWAMVPVRIDD
jgi:hypothetical protein